MNELRRLLEDPATDGRLREALQCYPVPAAIAPAAMDTLGSALSQGMASASVAPAGTAILAKLGAAKVGMAVLALGAGAIGMYAWKNHAGVDAVVPAATSTAIATPVAPPLEVTTPTVTATHRVDALAAVSSVKRTTPKPSVNVSSVAKTNFSQLQEEAMLLEGARLLLASDPARTLEQVALHRQRFARPVLGLERDLIAIDALCRLGHRTRAGTLAGALLVTQPQGMYAERVRALLARGCDNQSREDLKDALPPSNQSL